MAEIERLKELRAAGVKSATFELVPATGEQRVLAVEFFPRSLLDVADLVTGEDADPMNAATERPPAPTGDEDGPPNIPPAMARILSKGSVS